MKKKIIGVVSALVLVVILATCLVACNPYKWTGVGGGDPTAAVESNGGYVVKQGKYLYYINGYEGTGGEKNEWGTPVKQSIVRSEINEQTGAVDIKTTKVIVPKIIYNSSTKGGFAIYGEWIYYATPNNDKDKNGTASTTDTDFMRTKIDGSVTQRLGKINSRSAEYLFTEKRVLYYTSNTISYIDFSEMDNKTSFNNAKGAKAGVLAENVASVAWNMTSDTVYFTQNVTGENSYKNYNELCSVKVDGDGSDKTVLATEDTFVTALDSEGKKTPQTQPQNVFKFTLQGMFVEQDGAHTLYYTKTHYVSSDTADGLFCAKASALKETEKLLESSGATSFLPLGYEDGALVSVNSAYFWYNGTVAPENALQVLDGSKTIWRVADGYAYFTASSSAGTLEKITYKTAGNAVTILSENIKVDWLALDFVGDDFYFFATDDSNFMHTVNVKTFDKNAKDEEGNAIGSTYIGFEKEEDKDEEDK